MKRVHRGILIIRFLLDRQRTQIEPKIMRNDLQLRLREVLQNELDLRRQRNPRYSLRRFATYLGVDYSFLSKFLRGQKKIGKKNILSIRHKLELDSEIDQEIDKSVLIDEEEPQQVHKLESDILTEWFHFTILEYIRLPNKPPNLLSLCRQLEIDAEECGNFLDKLQAAGIQHNHVD